MSLQPRTMSFWIGCWVWIFWGGTLPLQAESEKSLPKNFEKEIQTVLERTRDCVVRIKTIVPLQDAYKGETIAEGLSVGTGFFVDDRGTILTAATVLRGQSQAVVYWRNKTYEAKSIGEDQRTNLALIKIDEQTPFLKPSEAPPKVGSRALAVGYPYDGSISVEHGYIWESDPLKTSITFATTHICSSVHVQPGQSGSPFLNMRGEVMGVVTFATQDGKATYALPIEIAQHIQQDLVKNHAAPHGWTGMTIEVKAGKTASVEDVVIRGVYHGQPAHNAGIQPGDILRKIGDKEIRTPADVMSATAYLPVGETVPFTIEREDTMKIFPVKIAPRPSEQSLANIKLLSPNP